MVLPQGTSIPDRLRCLSTLVREVVAHGVHHGVVGALTMAHLHRRHKVDLHRVEPGFSMAGVIPEDIDVRRLIIEFSGNAEAIAAIVEVEQIIKDAPL